jgi:Rps23 Pro-64 3,4-dihydroxylase Tpa1-like proline 4-hydroxylase
LKKITSILILSLFIYNTIGFLALHPILSIYYKYVGLEQANKPSEEEMIELLIFNKKDIQEGKIDFRWIHSREFKYNGDMYDIVKKEETDKQLIVHCINDTKEKKLEEEFEKRVHKNSSEDKRLPVKINIINSLFSEPIQSEQIKNDLVYEQSFNNWRTDFYQSLFLDIPSPPPRLA